jgi:hypothetical protein
MLKDLRSVLVFLSPLVLLGCAKYYSPETPRFEECMKPVEERKESCERHAREELEDCYRDQEEQREGLTERGRDLEMIEHIGWLIFDPVGTFRGAHDECSHTLYMCDEEYKWGWSECGGVIE